MIDPNEVVEVAKKHAFEYLRFKLGGRRGCRVLEDIDEESVAEIVAECALAMIECSTELQRLNK